MAGSGSARCASEVQKWLREEGYPLEFATAAAFMAKGFVARQGTFVADPNTGELREVDVVATAGTRIGDTTIRVEHVVECKWSGDKPWVVFTSPFTRMAPSACISQTLGSLLGQAVLWCEAGNSVLHSADAFLCPARGGFAGCQAFSNAKARDQLYSALQSVVSATRAVVLAIDEHWSAENGIPDFAAVAFPVVVVHGQLFEAYAEDPSGEVAVRETPRIRLHWRGSPSWRHFATVDIITHDHLQEFVDTRAGDVESIFGVFEARVPAILEWVSAGCRGELPVTSGPRGMLGLPRLLHALKATAARK